MNKYDILQNVQKEISLVVLERNHLPMQGTQVLYPVREDPT